MSTTALMILVLVIVVIVVGVNASQKLTWRRGARRK